VEVHRGFRAARAPWRAGSRRFWARHRRCGLQGALAARAPGHGHDPRIAGRFFPPSASPAAWWCSWTGCRAPCWAVASPREGLWPQGHGGHVRSVAATEGYGVAGHWRCDGLQLQQQSGTRCSHRTKETRESTSPTVTLVSPCPCIGCSFWRRMRRRRPSMESLSAQPCTQVSAGSYASSR
jgi:hypothetical protein